MVWDRGFFVFFSDSLCHGLSFWSPDWRNPKEALQEGEHKDIDSIGLARRALTRRLLNAATED
jgi:hypothetical protein